MNWVTFVGRFSKLQTLRLGLGLSFAFLLMLSLFASGAKAAPFGVPAEVAAFIQQQTEIRVYFPYDPENTPGMGHQSATVHLMDRLLELGFKGQFTIIYDKGGEKFLERLIPGINVAKRDFNSPRLPIKDIIRNNDRLSDMRRGGRLAELPLGITGGDDRRIVNRAWELNTMVFLSFDPLDREGMNRAWVKEKDQSVPLDHLRAQPYHYNLSGRLLSLEVLQEAREKIDQEGPNRYAFLTQLVKSMVARQADVLPFYESRKDRPENLQTIALGLKKALEERPELFSDVILVPIFNTIEKEEFRMLSDRFNGIVSGKGVMSNSESRLAGAPNVSFSILTPTQYEHGIPLPPAGKKAVHFVPVGSVPREVFEMIFANSSLPPVFNGRNTANLLFNTGQPFLMTKASFSNRARETVEGGAAKFTDGIVDRAYIEMATTMAGRKSKGEALAPFFIDVKSPNSIVRARFQAVSAEYQNQANDRLVHGLQAVREISREIRLKRCEAAF